MPEEKLDIRQALKNQGLIKSDPATPSVQNAPAPQPDPKPQVERQTPPVQPPKPPEFEFGSSKVPDPVKTPDPDPEAGDQKFPEQARQALRNQRERIKELEKKLGSATSEDAVKEWKQKLEQAYDKIAELDITHDPRFAEEFETPKQRLTEELRVVIEEFGGDPNDIIPNLRGKTQKEQIAYLKEALPDAMSPVRDIIRKIDEIDERRSGLLKQKDRAKQEIAARRLEAEKRMTEQAFEIAMEQEIQAGNPFLKEIPGNDTYNKNVQAFKAYVKSLANDNSPLALASLRIQAAEAQVRRTMDAKRDAYIAELENQIKAFGKSLPNSSGSKQPPSTPANPDGRMSAAEAAKRIAARY